MLWKHILGYAPSLLVPALASFFAVFAYTRLLSTAQYGQYALALNTMNLLSAVFFSWLQVSLPRLMPQAALSHRDNAFRSTAYAAFGLMAAVVLLLGGVGIGFVPLGDFREVAIAAVPLALARSLLNLHQAFHRSMLDFKSYNVIECGQAALGLVFGLALVIFAHAGNLGANFGMVLGMACMLSVDIKTMLGVSRHDVDPAILKEIVRFGAPLAASFAVGFIISSSDRYFITYFCGPAEVGIYAAGYVLVDRIMTIIYMAVATPSFPLAVQRLEEDGIPAAQNQMHKNAFAIVFLVLPACVGLLLANKQIVGTLIGFDFREGALRVTPWIVIASALNGLSMHYFSHAFHLAKRPQMLFWIQVPVAALNLALNALLIPPLGYMGAAYSAFASAVMFLAMSIAFGRRVFKFSLPYRDSCGVAASVALMALAISAFHFPVSVLGLIEIVGVGCLSYAAGIWIFNVRDVRAHVRAYMAGRTAR